MPLTPTSRTLRRAFLLIPALSAALCAATGFASPPWWNPAWKHRVTVVAPRDARNSLLVEFEAPQARPDGSDLCVFRAPRQPAVAWRLVHRTAAGKFVMELLLPDPATVAPGELPFTFFIYYGNPDGSYEKPAAEWGRQPVSVEMHALTQGQQPETWEELQFLLERLRREGDRAFVHEINPDALQFDRSKPNLDIYRAHLLCKTAADYVFSLDSAGASFLLIDGAVVAANDGNPRWGRTKRGHPVSLSEGIHRLELYHARVLPSAAIKLDWSAAEPTPPETATHLTLWTPFRGRLTARETLGESLNPFFTYLQKTSVRVNDVADEFVTVQFSDATTADGKIVSRLWDFGDGQTSNAQNPSHVYVGTRPCVVTLTVTDDKGVSSRCQRPIEWERTSPVPAQVVMELERLSGVITPEAELNFSVSVLNLRKREMDLIFRWTPLVLTADSSRPSDKRAEGKETSFKLGVEENRAVQVRTGEVRHLAGVNLELLYNNVVVARKTIRLQRAHEPLPALTVVGSHLEDAVGNSVILVADPLGLKQEASPPFPNRIVCLDDALCGDGAVLDGGVPYAEALQAALNATNVANSSVAVRHVSWRSEDRSQGGLPTLYKLARLNEAALGDKDLAIVSVGLPDLHDKLSPDEFGKQVDFIVDHLRLVRGANVLLVTPPPLPTDPEATRAFARTIIQVGLEKNVPVLDLYSKMRMRSDWRGFFRDTAVSGGAASFFFYPNAQGQKWIAEELARMLSGWQRPGHGR